MTCPKRIPMCPVHKKAMAIARDGKDRRKFWWRCPRLRCGWRSAHSYTKPFLVTA